MQRKSLGIDHKELYIGVMSGTSMDGVDTALVSIEDTGITLLAHDEFPMPEDIKARLLEVCIGQKTDLIAIGELDHQLGHLFADAVLQLLNKSDMPASSVTAIGNHGQTVFHQPTVIRHLLCSWVTPISLPLKHRFKPSPISDAKTWRLADKVRH